MEVLALHRKHGISGSAWS